MLFGHLPVHPILFIVDSYRYVSSLFPVEYLCCHSSHVVGYSLRSGKVSGNKPAFRSSEVKPCGSEHGFCAAHVHHHLRLGVVFHLHVCHLGESAHGEHEVLVAKRVLLGVHVSVLLQVIQREGSDGVHLGRQVEYLKKGAFPSDVVYNIGPACYLLLNPLLAHLVEIV